MLLPSGVGGPASHFSEWEPRQCRLTPHWLILPTFQVRVTLHTVRRNYITRLLFSDLISINQSSVPSRVDSYCNRKPLGGLWVGGEKCLTAVTHQAHNGPVTSSALTSFVGRKWSAGGVWGSSRSPTRSLVITMQTLSVLSKYLVRRRFPDVKVSMYCDFLLSTDTTWRPDVIDSVTVWQCDIPTCSFASPWALPHILHTEEIKIFSFPFSASSHWL